ncbi:MAG: molybdopterin-binding protein, partial [Atopostipes sp.]|nr:molybdopterin-binding protein [Atopostipes sp.]
MKAEIISCGTELLLGEVVDTNTSYLSRELAKIGVNVYHHTTVGDNPERLLETIVHAESRSNLIFLSGGLGPTADDITKDILANHLGLELVVDSTSLNKIKGRYSSEEISSENHHQSLVIDKATVLNNDIGMAAGMFVEKDNKNYVLLPGPPSEFEHMVSEHFVPLLIRRFD